MIRAWLPALALAAALAGPPALAANLPDWSGVWTLAPGGSGWDPSTITPKGGIGGLPGVREHPPLTAAWEKKYEANIDKVAVDRFPDPVSFCGTPSGFPRLMAIPDAYEFVVRPEQTWILTENGPNVMRIYTDGRAHLGPDDLSPTFMGDSVGRWEGDVLVFDTIGLNGDGHAILDRTGLTYSDKLHVVTRMHKVDADSLEATLTMEDPVMLTRPWTLVKRYKKQPPCSRVYDYACAENNRNPITASGQTLTLGTDGKAIDRQIDPASK